MKFPWVSPRLISLPVLLNDHTIYEHILDNNIFPGVVGMLECEEFALVSYEF